MNTAHMEWTNISRMTLLLIAFSFITTFYFCKRWYRICQDWWSWIVHKQISSSICDRNTWIHGSGNVRWKIRWVRWYIRIWYGHAWDGHLRISLLWMHRTSTNIQKGESYLTWAKKKSLLHSKVVFDRLQVVYLRIIYPRFKIQISVLSLKNVLNWNHRIGHQQINY